MLFRALFSGLFLLFATAHLSLADTASGFSTNYEYVADGCTNRGRGYSAAEFAKATADASAHLAHLNKLQKKSGGYSEKIREVKASKAQIQKCEKEQAVKLTVRRDIPCSDIVREYWANSVKGAALQDAGLATEADRKAARKKFQFPVQECAKERMQKCIDPNNTKEVMEAVELFELALLLRVIGSYAAETGADKFLSEISPLRMRPSFCSDTNYECDPATDPVLCEYYRTRIREAMETYVSRVR